MIEYQAAKRLPEDPAHPQVIKAASKLFLDVRGTLWANDAIKRPTERITPIGKSRTPVEEAMSNLL